MTPSPGISLPLSRAQVSRAVGLGALVLASVSGVASVASAQVPTTVQLPTFSQFSVGTTVVVPDRGSMVLGGVNRSAAGQVTRGVPGLSHLPGANRLFSNRAFGSSTSSSTARVSVWIHDLAAMDEALLAEAAARRTAAQADPAAPRDPLLPVARSARPTASRPSSPIPAGEPAASVADIRAAQASAAASAAEEAQQLIASGDQARAAGKPGAARLFYQMAARRSPSTAGPVVAERLQLLAVRP